MIQLLSNVLYNRRQCLRETTANNLVNISTYLTYDCGADHDNGDNNNKTTLLKQPYLTIINSEFGKYAVFYEYRNALQLFHYMYMRSKPGSRRLRLNGRTSKLLII